MKSGDLLRIRIFGENTWYCMKCGTKLQELRPETEVYDSVTGTPFKFVVRQCPFWKQGFIFDNGHSRGRLATYIEEH